MPGTEISLPAAGSYLPTLGSKVTAVACAAVGFPEIHCWNDQTGVQGRKVVIGARKTAHKAMSGRVSSPAEILQWNDYECR